MTNPITPKALHNALTEANKQKAALEKIVAAFNSRPETRDAVVEALGIKDLDKDGLRKAIETGYDAVCEHVRRLNDAYIRGVVTLPDRPD